MLKRRKGETKGRERDDISGVGLEGQ